MSNLPTYTVLYFRIQNGRAMSTISLGDYSQAGTVRAMSPMEATRKWNTKEYFRCLKSHRMLTIGDVLKCGKDFFILTPTGQWASVDLDEELEED